MNIHNIPMAVYNGVYILWVVIVYTVKIGSNIQKSDFKKNVLKS